MTTYRIRKKRACILCIVWLMEYPRSHKSVQEAFPKKIRARPKNVRVTSSVFVWSVVLRLRQVWYRTGQVVDNILQRVKDRLNMSTREVSSAVIVLHLTVWRVLRNERLHPYHAHKIQDLMLELSLALVHTCYSKMNVTLLLKAFLIRKTIMYGHLAIRTTHVLVLIRSV